MSTRLEGFVKPGLGHTSARRFDQCKAIFEKRGITFPPFFKGTVNIQLPAPFIPKDTDCVRLHVPASEMVGQKESWDLILVSRINGAATVGYIYKTSTDYHGPSVVELITYDLGVIAKQGATITLELSHSLGLISLPNGKNEL